jgi:hypothetical protein
MATWSEVEAAAPELAAGVKARFDAHKHKVMATLRKDGSPRVSGTELDFKRGEIWFGSMPNARKAQDLRRDPRIAFHSATVDPEMEGGDAKIGGRALEVTDPKVIAAFVGEVEARTDENPGEFHLFRVEVSDLALTTVDQERGLLIVDSWSEGSGVRHAERT